MNFTERCVELAKMWPPEGCFADSIEIIKDACEDNHNIKFEELNKKTIKELMLEMCKQVNWDAPEILVDKVISENYGVFDFRGAYEGKKNQVFVRTNAKIQLYYKGKIFYYNEKFYLIEDVAGELVSVYECENIEKALKLESDLSMQRNNPKLSIFEVNKIPELYEFEKRFPGDFFFYNHWDAKVEYCEECGDLIRLGCYIGNDGVCQSCDRFMCDKCAGGFNEEGFCKDCQNK